MRWALVLGDVVQFGPIPWDSARLSREIAAMGPSVSFPMSEPSGPVRTGDWLLAPVIEVTVAVDALHKLAGETLVVNDDGTVTATPVVVVKDPEEGVPEVPLLTDGERLYCQVCYALGLSVPADETELRAAIAGLPAEQQPSVLLTMAALSAIQDAVGYSMATEIRDKIMRGATWQ